MARMPRGEPRSVPDPAGEQYDEMIRQKRLREAVRSVAAAEFSSVPDGSEPFTSSDHRLDFLKQPSRADATLTAPMLGTGTRANWRRTPPGWQGNGREYNEARGHLLANQLGGSGGDMRNLVTLTHSGANNPQMQSFEDNVARRVGGGEVVEYSAIPMYDSGVLPPSGVLVTAVGSRATPSARFIQNPAGRPR